MKKTDVDKIDLDKPIKAYMAKPDKTLGEHYEDFLRQQRYCGIWDIYQVSICMICFKSAAAIMMMVRLIYLFK